MEFRMTEVILHVYDVTNSGSDKTNNTIMQINKIFKDGIGLGGIFHSAIQVSNYFSQLSTHTCNNLNLWFCIYRFSIFLFLLGIL